MTSGRDVRHPRFDDLLARPFGTLDQLIAAHGRERSRSLALVQDDRVLDYRALDARMDRIAASLQRDGIGRGAVVAICATTSIDYAVCFLATLRAGAAIAPLAPSSTAESLSRMLEDCGAGLLFLDRATADLLGPANRLGPAEGGPRRVALDGSTAGRPSRIGWRRTARIVGAGGGAQEIVMASMLGPKWRFTAVDPSQPMMNIAVAQLTQKGLATRTEFHLGYVDDLPLIVGRFDAATLIGVLHHQRGDKAKRNCLTSIASRLTPGAPLVLAGNRHAYVSLPLLLAAWGERWRMQGATEEEVHAKLGTILEGADPPVSEDAAAELLANAGFEPPTWFFSSLFWGACLAKRTLEDAPSIGG